MNELHSVPSVPSSEIQAEDAVTEQPPSAAQEAVTEQSLIETEDLIEEISIDGMCGVY